MCVLVWLTKAAGLGTPMYSPNVSVMDIMAYKIGVDVGTFTDFPLAGVDDGTAYIYKVPSTPEKILPSPPSAGSRRWPRIATWARMSS